MAVLPVIAKIVNPDLPQLHLSGSLRGLTAFLPGLRIRGRGSGRFRSVAQSRSGAQRYRSQSGVSEEFASSWVHWGSTHALEALRLTIKEC